MSVITERNESLRVFEKAAERGTSIGIFCTASYWNTEAILIAAQRIAEKYQIEKVPVVVATTFTYPHMPQSGAFCTVRIQRPEYFLTSRTSTCLPEASIRHTKT